MACRISKSDWTFELCMLVTICFWGSASTIRMEAAVVSFGSGSNQFQLEFVSIGNPGNAADTTGDPNPVGRVDYSYGIAKFEISRAIINKYNLNFGNSNSLAITLNDMSQYGGNGVSKPATGVSWNEAGRFINWLNTSTGGFRAYKYVNNGVNDNIVPWSTTDTLDYDPSNKFRSKRAKYVLPSYNEWYKAAYYDTSKKIYYDYPTGSDTAPISVTSGTMLGTAVYNLAIGQGPANVDDAGGLNQNGIMGMAGNVYEWEESTYNISTGNYNSSGSSTRGARGGVWSYDAVSLLSNSSRLNIGSPAVESSGIGFRVVTLASSGGQVPEPSSMAIFGLGALCLASRARRKSDATSC